MTQIVAVVTYRLPEGTTREDAYQMFRDSIPRYMATEGLLRKNVLYAEGVGGGAYLWESRSAAEKAYSPEWRAYMTEKYDHPPEVVYYDSPITMDRQYDVVYDEQAVANAAE
jgi:hypothetical protein